MSRLQEIEEKILAQANRARIAMPDHDSVRVYINEEEAIIVAEALGKDPKIEGEVGDIFLDLINGAFQYTDEIGPIMVEVRNTPAPKAVEP